MDKRADNASSRRLTVFGLGGAAHSLNVTDSSTVREALSQMYRSIPYETTLLQDTRILSDSTLCAKLCGNLPLTVVHRLASAEDWAELIREHEIIFLWLKRPVEPRLSTWDWVLLASSSTSIDPFRFEAVAGRYLDYTRTKRPLSDAYGGCVGDVELASVSLAWKLALENARCELDLTKDFFFSEESENWERRMDEEVALFLGPTPTGPREFTLRRISGSGRVRNPSESNDSNTQRFEVLNANGEILAMLERRPRGFR